MRELSIPDEWFPIVMALTDIAFAAGQSAPKQLEIPSLSMAPLVSPLVSVKVVAAFFYSSAIIGFAPYTVHNRVFRSMLDSRARYISSSHVGPAAGATSMRRSRLHPRLRFSGRR